MTARLALVTLAFLAATGASAQISADRPGLALSPSTVGAGVFQVEAGTPEATIFGTDTETYAVPVAVRYGVTPAVEIRAATSVFDVVRVPGETDAQVGFRVLTLGAKLAVPVRGVEAAVVPELLVPTDGDGDVAFQLNVPVSVSVGDVGVGLSSGIVTGGGETSASAIAALSRAFGPLSAYAETAAFPSLDGGGTPVQAGAGVAALLGPDVQVDAFFDAGLTDDAPDLFVGIGIAYRLRPGR